MITSMPTVTLETLIERHAQARQQAAEHARQSERWTGAAEELARLIEEMRVESQPDADHPRPSVSVARP